MRAAVLYWYVTVGVYAVVWYAITITKCAGAALMITTGSKWFFGLGFVTFALAAAYGWTTGGNGLGPLTVGYKGGVGDHFGYGVLVTGAVVSLLLGWWSPRCATPTPSRRPGGRRRTVPAVTARRHQLLAGRRRFGAGLVVVGLVSAPRCSSSA